MAYRLEVRSLVYERGVGIRETVSVGVWFGKTNSVGVDLFLHAESSHFYVLVCINAARSINTLQMGHALEAAPPAPSPRTKRRRSPLGHAEAAPPAEPATELHAGHVRRRPRLPACGEMKTFLARCRGRTFVEHVEHATALPTRGQPEQLNSPPALLPVHAGGPRLASRAPRAPLDLPARRHKATGPRERHTCASSGGLPLGWSAAPPPLLRTAAYHGAQPCSHLCHPVASRPRAFLYLSGRASVSLSIYLAGPAQELGAWHGLADARGQALPRDARSLQADAPPHAPYQPDPPHRAIHRPYGAGAGGRKQRLGRKRSPIWPASAAQAADWPSPAEAPSSLWHALVRRASCPKPVPPWCRHTQAWPTERSRPTEAVILNLALTLTLTLTTQPSPSPPPSPLPLPSPSP